MRVNFVRAASLIKATKKLVRVCVWACVCVRVCTCVCAGKREKETGVTTPNDFFVISLLRWYKIEFITFQNVNWLPFARVPAAVWVENQPHYSGNTETAVGSHLGQSFSFFLLCLSTLTGLKRGKRDWKRTCLTILLIIFQSFVISKD